ncbi:hypothetical protein [Castellaniella sp. UC4442_H9]
MNALLVPLLFLSLLSPAFGSTSDCDAISRLAKAVMTGRQGTDAMADMMDRVMKSDLNDYTKNVGKKVIISAYEDQRHYVDWAIEKEIVEFQNRWYMKCIKGKIDEK